jgi:glutathione S-transferase
VRRRAAPNTTGLVERCTRAVRETSLWISMSRNVRQEFTAMKLYFAPGFSSLADHIAMLEAGLEFDIVKVDISTKQIDGGGRYADVNSKEYVPALMLDDGQVLTENVAILTWVADLAPALAPSGNLGRYRLIEMLSFIATEIHKRFPIYLTAPEESKAPLRADIVRWLEFLGRRIERDYLFGDVFSAADAYLFVMARGAAELGFALPERLRGYIARIEARPSVQLAMRREGA